MQIFGKFSTWEQFELLCNTVFTFELNKYWRFYENIQTVFKETHTHDKLLFDDFEIVSFLDTLGCIVQFQFKKS